MVQPKNTKIESDIMATIAPVVARVEEKRGALGSKISFISETVSEWGYQDQDFLSGSLALADIVHPQDRAALTEKVAQHQSHQNDRFTLSHRVVTAEGESFWVSTACTVVRGQNGEVLHTDCMISVDAPGTEPQTPARNGLSQQYILGDILQALQKTRPEEVLQAVLGIVGRYLGVDAVELHQDVPALSTSQVICRWRKGAPCGNTSFAECVPHAHMADLHQALSASSQYILGENAGPYFVQHGVQAALALQVFCGEHPYGFVLFEDRSAPRQWTEDTLAFLHNISGVISVVLQQHSVAEQARNASWRDQLTGLYNRYPFDQFLRKAMGKAKQCGRHGYVLFIDLDDFKVINEGYGLEYGDALLTEVAGYLLERYGGYGQLFRFGGDEFVILVDQEHADCVPAIKEEILSRSRHPWSVLGSEFYCTTSLGLVRFPEPGMKVADVIRHAEIAVHNAKSIGKNMCVVFNDGMDSDTLNRVEMEHRMREAIENGCEGFEVYYQPVVDAQGVVKGAEALLRWFDKEGNMTSPTKFIPLAEYLGLIVPLGAHVLREAAKECHHINKTFPEFSININVSIRQFQHPDFLAEVENVLAETGIDSSNVVLEITEGKLVEDFEQLQLVLERLRMMGLRIAMDDFGTGYSSLSNMRRMPLDIVKIDRAFVMDVTHDAYSQSFIRLITNLTHSMGRKVCVEGVETAAQYSYCAECRVNLIQGFYFYKPMPKKELRAAINQNRARKG